jgi:hypothetical protein
MQLRLPAAEDKHRELVQSLKRDIDSLLGLNVGSKRWKE